MFPFERFGVSVLLEDESQSHPHPTPVKNGHQFSLFTSRIKPIYRRFSPCTASLLIVGIIDLGELAIKYFASVDDFFIQTLNSMVPLYQIKKSVVQHFDPSMYQFMDILCFTSNLYSVKTDCLLPRNYDPCEIKKDINLPRITAGSKIKILDLDHCSS